MHKLSLTRRLMVGVAALCAAASTAVVTMSTATDSGAAGGHPAKPTATTTNAVQQFTQEVQALGGSQYSTTFGGVWQGATGMEHVGIAQGTAEHPAVMAAAFASAVADLAAKDRTGNYVVTAVTHPYSALASLTQTVANDQTQLASAGIQLVTWGPDPASNTVKVSVQNYTSQDQGVFDALFGVGWVSVASDPFSGAPKRTTRFDDYAPFYGGDRIWNNTTYSKATKCTDSFNYVGKASGLTYMLTAGHCFAVGQTIYTNLHVRQTIGSVTAKHFTNNGFDIATISITGAGIVWTTGTNWLPIHGAGDPPVGQTVTVNGSFSGVKHGVPVTATTKCVKFGTGVTTCHLDYAYNGSPICTTGDSGGPVYQRLSTGGADARGVVIGVAPTLTCFFQEITPTLSLVNGRIMTSTA